MTTLVVVLALGVALGALAVSSPPDAELLRRLADAGGSTLEDLARPLHRLTEPTAIALLRLALVVVLVVYGRLRHLGVAIATIWLVDVVVHQLAVTLPTPAVTVTVPPPDGYAFPTPAIASFATTVAVATVALVPEGRPRRIALVAGAALCFLVGIADVLLGTAYPLCGAYAVALAYALTTTTFGWLAPDDAFPVTYERGRTAAHLDLAGARTDAVVRAMRDQLGLAVTDVRSFGEEGSGGSTPLLMTLEDGRRLFGKILATSHVRADRWYRVVRTILYGRLEDETSFTSVRQLIEYEDYALRLLADEGFHVARTYGIVELTPSAEYLIVTEFFEGAETLGHADVTDTVVEDGIELVRRLWDAGLAHRDLKPANLLVVQGHLQVIDVSVLEVRPSPWRQAVDLANMLLVLGLRHDPEDVYSRALRAFTPEELGEAFASAQGMAIPTQLQRSLTEEAPDLLERYRTMAPPHPPVSIQRWSARRIGLAVGVAVGTLGLAAWSVAVLFATG